MAYPKVTVVGAGQVGATAAELIALRSLADVVMIDVAEGLPQGKALDLMHMRSVTGFSTIVTGTNDYADTAGSDVVVITAGLARKPGMTRDDLLDANSKIMRSVISAAAEASPEAVFICVTNPLDIMTYLAWKESGLPSSRVIGMGGVLDSARFAFAIAEKLGCGIAGVKALACGAHGEAMVPLPRHSTVEGVPLTDLLPPDEIAALVARTVNGGAEVVALLKTGSAYYAPAASIVAMVAAVLGDTGEVLPSCVHLGGPAKSTEDVYLSVPARLGRRGLVELAPLELDASEREAFAASIATVISQLDALGLRD